MKKKLSKEEIARIDAEFPMGKAFFYMGVAMRVTGFYAGSESVFPQFDTPIKMSVDYVDGQGVIRQKMFLEHEIIALMGDIKH